MKAPNIANSFDTLTEYEKTAISGRINLSDGHARQERTSLVLECLERFSHALQYPGVLTVRASQERFVDTFFRLAKQSRPGVPRGRASGADRTLICHSASSACEIVANFLRLRRMTTALLVPTFDNIPSILRRHGVKLVPVDESGLSDGGLVALLAAAPIDCVFLVIPNNPTGARLDEEMLERIVGVCRSRRILLVVDFAFRLFDETLEAWDQYNIVESSGVSYILLEDTGKVWPIDDLKVGVLTMSRDICDAVGHIHDDFLLNASASLLGLLADLNESTLSVGSESAIRADVRFKSAEVRRLIAGTGFQWDGTNDSMSVAWLRITNDLCDEEVYRHCVQRGVHILPGSLFFWHKPARGRSHVRVALSRDLATIAEGVEAMLGVASRWPAATPGKRPVFNQRREYR